MILFKLMIENFLKKVKNEVVKFQINKRLIFVTRYFTQAAMTKLILNF
jgi:hypothetical protein